MESEHGANKNGHRKSFSQRLKRLFQTTWAKEAEEHMEKRDIDDAGGHRAACPACGSPVIKFRNYNGADYMVAVAETALMQYFQRKGDIDEFIHDRLVRAETIIIELRKENALLRKHLG